MLRQAARAGGALRRFATATPEPDLVAAAFVSQQVKLRALIAGGKGMAMPVDGDAASISKFKTDYEALRKKVCESLSAQQARCWRLYAALAACYAGCHRAAVRLDGSCVRSAQAWALGLRNVRFQQVSRLGS